jgi:hypothetical protein
LEVWLTDLQSPRRAAWMDGPLDAHGEEAARTGIARRLR